jgi:hypothetical protein
MVFFNEVRDLNAAFDRSKENHELTSLPTLNKRALRTAKPGLILPFRTVSNVTRIIHIQLQVASDL